MTPEAWIAAAKGKAGLALLGALGGFALRMLHSPPRIWRDVWRHALAAVLMVFFLSGPIADLVVQSFGMAKATPDIMVAVGIVIGFAGLQLIDVLVDRFKVRMR